MIIFIVANMLLPNYIAAGDFAREIADQWALDLLKQTKPEPHFLKYRERMELDKLTNEFNAL